MMRKTRKITSKQKTISKKNIFEKKWLNLKSLLIKKNYKNLPENR